MTDRQENCNCYVRLLTPCCDVRPPVRRSDAIRVHGSVDAASVSPLTTDYRQRGRRLVTSVHAHVDYVFTPVLGRRESNRSSERKSGEAVAPAAVAHLGGEYVESRPRRSDVGADDVASTGRSIVDARVDHQRRRLGGTKTVKTDGTFTHAVNESTVTDGRIGVRLDKTTYEPKSKIWLLRVTCQCR